MRLLLIASVLSFLSSAAVAASAADIYSVASSVDPDASVERAGSEVTIVTSARRVTPHDSPFTIMVEALCDQPAVLEGIEKVTVLNSFAFKGVEFWTYDDTPDLTGSCAAIADGQAIQMYSVMH